MYLAYSKSQKIAVLTDNLDSPEIVCRAVGDETETVLFLDRSDLRITGKIQGSDKQITTNLQASDKQITTEIQSDYTQLTAIEKARGHRPKPLSLEEEVQEKWPIISALFLDDFYNRSDSIPNFENLLQKLKSGERKNVPRPVCTAVNNALNTDYAIPTFNRAVLLYLAYERNNKIPTLFYSLNNLLNQIDKLITKYIYLWL